MDEIKLLIVDDNINLIKMLKEFFKKSNKVKIVAEAYNGEDGLDLIQKEYGNFRFNYAKKRWIMGTRTMPRKKS